MDQTQIKPLPKPNIPCFVITPLLLLALTIAHIAIGAAYIQDCPQQHHIPVYLLVCGVFTVVLALLFFATLIEKGETMLSRIYSLIVLVSIFLFCWMICGSAWIYSIYPPNYNQTVAGEPYCNKTLYLFAFLTTILGNILIGLALLFGCFICVFVIYG